jgi:hypothetical protein
MSSAPIRAYSQTPNTATRVSTSSFAVMTYANHLIEMTEDRALYEEDTEQRPNGVAIAQAAQTLAAVEQQFRESFEVEPFWGTLSLIWRAPEKRVKVTFGSGTPCVYSERMVNGHVTESRLETPESGQFLTYLGSCLSWL